MDAAVEFGGFWRRFLAYVVDVVPITLAVAALYYFVLGFDRTVAAYVESPRDPEVRRAFLIERKEMGRVSFAVLILYGAFLEASSLQGTLGKRLLGLRVVDAEGERLTLRTSMARNFGKPLSALVLGIGFLAAAWSPTKQAWHDRLSNCFVVKDRREELA